LEARECEFHPGQVWSLKQAVGVMGEVQLGAKLNHKEENHMVVLTCS
jgi:cytochrome c peroxidase